MKKVLLSIFAVAALASCFQNEELVGTGNKEQIEFADTYVGGVTKAIDGSYSNTNMFNKFQVYGTLENNGAVANIFNGVDVMKGGAGWYYSDDYTTYWISGNTYTFAAVVAGNEAGETAVAVDANGMPTTITLSDASAQNDILYAEKEPIHYTGNAEPVRFVFEHLLAKAKVSVRNIIQSNNGGYYVVEDVKLNNAIESATYDIETKSWADYNGEYVLEFGHIVAANETTEGANAINLGSNGKGSSNYERLIVPQANCPLTISIKYAYYDKNDAAHLQPTVKEVSTEANIEAGKAYNFVLTLAEPGEKIEFDVLDITDWVEDGVTTVAQLKDVFANGGSVMLANDLDLGNEELDIAAGKSVVLNLNGHTIKGVDAGTKSYALIEVLPGASLTINDTLGGKIVASAEQNRGWNAYSSVISNQRGTLTVNGGTIEHLGGTNMAYAIDNLTNGKNTVAVATINGGTIKSTYRAIRQFLNGTEAQNDLTVNGGVIYSTGGNKAIWMQSASVKANSGKLVVTEGAQLKSDVYVDAENATAIDLDVTVASAALVAPATVVYDLPAGYAVMEENGTWSLVEASFVSTQQELKAAIAANEATIYVSGQIDLTEEVLANYGGTIIGVDNTACLNTRTFNVLSADEAFHLSTKTVNFKDITIMVPAEDGDFLKTGFVAGGTMNFDNCVFEGQVTLNGSGTWTFNKCKFGGADDGAYASFVYGATKVTFTDCSFSGVDRAAKIYGSGGAIEAEYNNCTFTSTTSNKYAVNIDASYATTKVALNGCSQTGMPGLYAVVGAKATVWVDGVQQ